jgi:hypothetical protein
LAFVKKLGLILFLSGASQHEKALLLIYFQLGSEEKLRDIIARTYD